MWYKIWTDVWCKIQTEIWRWLFGYSRTIFSISDEIKLMCRNDGFIQSGIMHNFNCKSCVVTVLFSQNIVIFNDERKINEYLLAANV